MACVRYGEGDLASGYWDWTQMNKYKPVPLALPASGLSSKRRLLSVFGFFPSMLPARHTPFQRHASHLLPAAPRSPRGPASQQTAPSPQRGPGQPPTSPLPPCLLSKAEIWQKGEAEGMNEQAGSSTFHKVGNRRQIKEKCTPYFSAEMTGDRRTGCQPLFWSTRMLSDSLWWSPFLMVSNIIIPQRHMFCDSTIVPMKEQDLSGNTKATLRVRLLCPISLGLRLFKSHSLLCIHAPWL